MNKVLIRLVVGTTFAIVLLSLMAVYYQSNQHSKAYQFTNAVLDSLSIIQSAQEEARTKSVNEIVRTLEKQIEQFKFSKSKISPYTKEKNEYIGNIANGMMLGIDGLIKVNHDSLELLNTSPVNSSKINKQIEEENNRLNAMQQESYKVLGMSTSFVGYVIFAPSKTKNPKGAISYNMSVAERKSLLVKIDNDFGKNLNRYYIYRADHSKGNPSDQNWIIYSVDNIKKFLTPDTYEEAKELFRE